jgi:hypothetical protein
MEYGKWYQLKKERKMDEDYCEKSEDNKHEPDWGTVTVQHDVDTYIDVNCKHCGKSGCIGNEETLKQDISW